MSAPLYNSKNPSSVLAKRIAASMAPYYKLHFIQSAIAVDPNKKLHVKYRVTDPGEVFKRKILKLRPTTQRSLIAKCCAELNKPALSTVLKTNKLNPFDERPIFDQAQSALQKMYTAQLKEIVQCAQNLEAASTQSIHIGNYPPHPIGVQGPTSTQGIVIGDYSPITVNQLVRVGMKSVECVHETYPQWAGEDEIDMAFVCTDEKGNVSKMDPFHVGDFSEDKEDNEYLVTYNPEPKTIAEFKLDADYTKSKYFTVTALMSEIDLGGFADLLADVYDAVRMQITGLLVNAGIAVGGAAGAYVAAGSIAGSIAGPLGMLIGMVVMLLIGALISWIISGFKDDPFGPVTFAFSLPAADCSFDGNSQLKMFQETFLGNEGEYNVEFQISLIR